MDSMEKKDHTAIRVTADTAALRYVRALPLSSSNQPHFPKVRCCLLQGEKSLSCSHGQTDMWRYAGWWFGRIFIFPLGISWSQLTFTPWFFRGTAQPPTRKILKGSEGICVFQRWKAMENCGLCDEMNLLHPRFGEFFGVGKCPFFEHPSIGNIQSYNVI